MRGANVLRESGFLKPSNIFLLHLPTLTGPERRQYGERIESM
jgi:hypothetical protein